MQTFSVMLAAGALVVAGCGGPEASPGDGGASATDAESTRTPTPATGTASATPSTSPPAAATEAGAGRTPEARPRTGRVVTSGASQYGRVLFDRSGQAIYVFDLERTTSPECYAACAEAWPPVLTRGAPRAAGGVRQRLLGTTRRTDGTRQVTYADRPLYYYAHEPKDVVRCHDVPGFGGLWLALTPSGRPPG